MGENPSIWLFGYQGERIDALQAFIEQHDALLIDIRYRPVSRNPVWQKAALLRRFGERYKHVQALGNVRFRSGPPITLADGPAGVRELLRLLAGKQALVLMCVCRDARSCHRAVVADELRKRGFPSRELDLEGRLW